MKIRAFLLLSSAFLAFAVVGCTDTTAPAPAAAGSAGGGAASGEAPPAAKPSTRVGPDPTAIAPGP